MTGVFYSLREPSVVVATPDRGVTLSLLIPYKPPPTADPGLVFYACVNQSCRVHIKPRSAEGGKENEFKPEGGRSFGRRQDPREAEAFRIMGRNSVSLRLRGHFRLLPH